MPRTRRFTKPSPPRAARACSKGLALTRPQMRTATAAVTSSASGPVGIPAIDPEPPTTTIRPP